MRAQGNAGRHIRVGDVLSRTARALSRHAGPIGALAGIGAAGSRVLAQLPPVLGLDTGPGHAPDGLAMLFVGTGSFVLAAVVNAAIAHLVVKATARRTPSMGEALGVAIRRMPSVVGAALLTALASVVAAIFCIVPMFWAITHYVVAATVATVEPVGAFEALVRSSDLGRGQRLTILVTIISLSPVVVAIYGGAILVQSLALEHRGFSVEAGTVLVAQQTPLSMTLMGVAQIAVTSLSATLSAVLYQRLTRKRRDPRRLARIFE